MTTDDLVRLRDAVRGMRQNIWLRDIFEVQLGVAGRLGEILALTVNDLDLDNADGPHVLIAATVVCPAGQKFFRQPHTKDGPEGRRLVIVPDWVADILRRRAPMAAELESGLIFCTRNQTLLDPHNVRGSWRNIRKAADLVWMTPHHLRKTALSKVESVFGLAITSEFADHKTTEVTRIHYVEKIQKAGPDVRRALNMLAPDN